MRREIRCCKEELPKMELQHGINSNTGDPIIFNPYPGEHSKTIKGKAKHSMTCDWCGKQINQGDEVYAVTMWMDDVGLPYYPWEDKYLEIN